MLDFQGMSPALHVRSEYVNSIHKALRRSPVVAILGPRQVGKTTLARLVAKGREPEWFDMENAIDANRLREPMQALSSLKGLVVIDEIQHSPTLFELLRVLVDRPDNRARFLILGSAAPHLVKGVSESLAGRIAMIDLPGFRLNEVPEDRQQRLWIRGGFPRSFLARSESDSFAWRKDYVRTILERDVPQLGITVPASTLERFWSMVAHYHGQVLNQAELARALGSSEPTVRRYLDILTGLFLVRQLQPWFENVGKRQVKSPKLYVRDTGLLHTILGLPQLRDVQGHPKLGASWEGFVIEQILSQQGWQQGYFWATHAGAELDLLLVKGTRRIGIEVKYADAPKLTKSMTIAAEELHLNHLWAVYPGEKSYSLAKNVEAVGLPELLHRLPRSL